MNNKCLIVVQLVSFPGSLMLSDPYKKLGRDRQKPGMQRPVNKANTINQLSLNVTLTSPIVVHLAPLYLEFQVCSHTEHWCRHTRPVHFL